MARGPVANGFPWWIRAASDPVQVLVDFAETEAISMMIV
jgi:hypothetical protein